MARFTLTPQSSSNTSTLTNQIHLSQTHTSHSQTGSHLSSSTHPSQPLSTNLSSGKPFPDRCLSTPALIRPPVPLEPSRLSLLVLKELALLEHAFSRSPLHSLLRRLTPAFLPGSPALPFLATLAVGLAQLRRLWRAQRALLVQLLATGAPTVRTLRALARARARPGSDTHTDELTRWGVYWLLYAALATLEAVELPRAARAQPSIYPAVSPAAPSLVQRLSRLADALRTRLAPRRGPSPPTLSLATPIPVRGPARVSLPAHMFGDNSALYVLLKLLLLRWSATSGCALKIWNALLAPLADPAPPSDPPSKIVRVLVSTIHDPPPNRHEPEPVRRTHSDPLIHSPSVPARTDDHPDDSQDGPDSEDGLLIKQTFVSGPPSEFKSPENAWQAVGQIE